jgi:hypothetical protein
MDKVATESRDMRQFAVEKMTLDDFKTSEMTLKGLIDWLLESHIHFFFVIYIKGVKIHYGALTKYTRKSNDLDLILDFRIADRFTAQYLGRTSMHA